MKNFIVATILELLGIAAIAVGAGLIYLPAGVVIAGFGLVVVGLCVDPPVRPLKREGEPVAF